uniref:Uncharacterized protein n=1 Tax=Sphaerodactylus townsendi TaxID=933632 RepID=A0ACB8FEL8_9SAUR
MLLCSSVNAPLVKPCRGSHGKKEPVSTPVLHSVGISGVYSAAGSEEGGGEAPEVRGKRRRPPAPPRLTLGDGDGLEPVQLPQQAAPLGGVQAVDEVAGALRRVERLHGLLLGVGAQRAAGAPPAAPGAATEEQEAAAAAAEAAAPEAAEGPPQRPLLLLEPEPGSPEERQAAAEPRRHAAPQREDKGRRRRPGQEELLLMEPRRFPCSGGRSAPLPASPQGGSR